MPSQEQGFTRLGAILARGAADIGAHLQPWINPPFDAEERADSVRCSIPGNLLPALEHAKLQLSTDRIETNLGQRPRIYRAGRYGLGPASLETIDALD